MAGDKDFTVHLKADDQITPAAKKAADALKKLEKPVEVEIDGDVSGVLRAFDQVAAEAKETAAAAEVLGRALGPELAAKADTTAIVQDLKQAGLTIDQITGNADQLAAKLKEVADADVGGKLGANLGTARGQIDTMSDSARGANNALANMIGNSTQDIAAMGGVAGSAGVAVGQLGEFAIDAALGGEKLSSALLSMAKVAGPVAALGIATAVVSKELARAAASKAFNAAQLKEFTTSVEDTGGVLKAINDQLEDTGQLIFKIAGGFDAVDVGGDIAPMLAQLNLSTADFLALVNSGDASWTRFMDGLKAAGVSEQDLINIQVAHGRILADQARATEIVALKNDLLGDSADDATSALARQRAETALANSAAQARVTALENEKTAEDNLRTATEAYTTALNAQLDAMFAAADAGIAASEAQEDFVAAAVESAAVQADSVKTSEEKAAAVDAERDAMIGAAQAQVRLADENAKANGTVLSATERVDAYNSSLLSNARYATPAAQRAAYEYILQVNDIPAEKATEILALVDQGRLDEADAKINATSRARTVAVTADAHTDDAESEIQNLIRTRNMTINAQIIARGGAGYAQPGEGAGPRMVEPMVAGLTAAPTATAVAPMAVAPLTLPPIIINVPPQPVSTIKVEAGVLGNRFDVDRTITKAFRRHQRLNGIRE